MQLTALVQSPDHVCCRYRLAAFRKALAEAGHHLELRAFPKHPWSWFGLSRQLPPSSVVIIQRKLLSAWQLFLLRRHGRRLVFDFDDAVFLRDSYSRRGLDDGGRMRRFRGMARAVDAFAAGNEYLQDAARQAGAHGRLAVIPTCVDVDAYPLAEHRKEGEGVELVWIGSSSTLQGLERIRPLLEEVGRRNPGVRLKLVCDRFLHFDNLPVKAVNWTEAGEATELAGADIGIGWVPDDRWSRGKCGLKVLQYMAAGLPVIANPVGVQAAMVCHGETGFRAETDVEWIEAIGRLVHDRALRLRLGRAGRRLVEGEYSVAAGAAKWRTLLEELAPSLAA